MASFADFQKMNSKRCVEAFGHTEENWPSQNWALAIAGEAGELCNLVKKVLRGDFSWEQARQGILYELADVITYCDLMMTALGADTETELYQKFNQVSLRVQWSGFTINHDA